MRRRDAANFVLYLLIGSNVGHVVHDSHAGLDRSTDATTDGRSKPADLGLPIELHEDKRRAVVLNTM